MPKHESHKWVYAAIAGSTIVSLAVMIGVVPMLVNQAIVDKEIDQVGGKANYEKLYKFQKDQAIEFANSLDSDGSAGDNAAPAPADTDDSGDTPTPPAPAATSIDPSEVAGILEGAYFMGNPNAKIVWLEYSDLECPFCKKLHDAGSITDVMEKYGDDVAFSFTHFPLGFHANAQKGAEAAECAAELAGADKYHDYIEGVFSQGTPVMAVLKDEASKLGIDETAFLGCLDSGKYADKVKAEMSEGGSTFGVTGTPGNVLLNTQTGEFRLVAGAYPTAEFIKNIDELLGN